MKKLYKLRHKSTGLFFKQSKYGSKANLSENGKTYDKMPSLSYLGSFIRTHDGIVYVVPTEWEIVVYTVQETETIQFES